MAITFVAAATAWTSTAAGSNAYTINAPAGLSAGDLMIAAFVWTTGSTDTDLVCTAPTGWTKQDEVFNAGDGWDSQLCIMTRAYQAGDPSTWSGTLSNTTAKAKVVGTAAYRGVQSILTKGTSSLGYNGGTASYSSATVNNTLANSWRFVAAGYESTTDAYPLNTNEITSRTLASANATADSVQVRMADSGASIATGNTSRTFTRSASWDASCSWIAILQESSGTAASGTFNFSLGGVSMGGTGEIHNDGTSAITLGGVTQAFSGFGTPPAVTSDMAMSLGSVTSTFAAGVPITGSMSMMVLPGVQIQGETRVFGVRVIVIERETERIIVVPSRGVDD